MQSEQRELRVVDGKVTRRKVAKVRERERERERERSACFGKSHKKSLDRKNRFIWSQIATMNGVITKLRPIQTNVEIVHCPGAVYAAVVRLSSRLSVTNRYYIETNGRIEPIFFGNPFDTML